MMTSLRVIISIASFAVLTLVGVLADGDRSREHSMRAGFTLAPALGAGTQLTSMTPGLPTMHHIGDLEMLPIALLAACVIGRAIVSRAADGDRA